ncbi:MAG: IS1 family transposase, partial [Gammaproteobacteria bacterium]
GFSKKLENHAHMIALYVVFYNFTKIHKTLRITPAMQAGLTDHVWDMEEVIRLLEEVESPVPVVQAN